VIIFETTRESTVEVLVVYESSQKETRFELPILHANRITIHDNASITIPVVDRVFRFVRVDENVETNTYRLRRVRKLLYKPATTVCPASLGVTEFFREIVQLHNVLV
jgi:hypothetical protein